MAVSSPLFDSVVSRFDHPKPHSGGVKVQCPCHDDAPNKPSLNISVGDDGRIVMHCFAGCKNADILEKKGMGFGELFPEKARAFVRNTGREAHHLSWYDYSDESGKLLYQAGRKQFADDKQFFQRKPKPGGGWDYTLGNVRRVLFNLAAVIRAIEAGEPTIKVEGEKDVLRLGKIGFTATTNVGGSNAWRQDYAQALDGADVVVSPDHDQPGYAHALDVVRSLEDKAASILIVQIVGLPEKSDISDLMDHLGNHAAEDITSIVSGSKTSTVDADGIGMMVITVDDLIGLAAKSKVPEPPTTPKRLEEFAPYVNELLNRRAARRDKQEVAELIGDYFADNDRLLIDDGAGHEASSCPYLITDDDTVVSLAGESRALRAALADCGINPTEPAYQWLLAVLQERARKGRSVRLARYWHIGGETLYVSCGATSLVRVAGGKRPELLPNGTDGVLFAADAVMPVWDPTVDSIDPLTIKGFRPPLDTPGESDGYTPDVQVLLCRAWLICLIAGLRPLPILTATGQKGAGKSTFMKSIGRLLMGPTADVNDSNLDARDFAACVTQLPLLVLDNLDNDPPHWLRDAMASATTGQTIMRRKLFTDTQLTREPAIAALGVTTRTASFAGRLDMQERVLPIFTGRPPGRREPDRVITAEVVAARDGCLVWLAQAAISALVTMDSAPSDLPGRFVDFERVVWTLDKNQARPALTALQRAQLLAVTDPDPLLSAIVTYVDDGLQGSASDIVRDLTSRGALLPYFGSGKAIANRLRELTETLRLVAIRLEDRSDANRHRTFNIYRVKIDAQTAQSAHPDNPTREKVNGNGSHKSGESPGKSADCAVCADDSPNGKTSAQTLQDLTDETGVTTAHHKDQGEL